MKAESLKFMGNFHILGDWGTSSCRFFLCEGAEIKAQFKGEGIKFVTDPKTYFETATHIWRQEHGEITSYLCGMVGANIGWQDAGYVDCPCDVESVKTKLSTLSSETGPVHLVPGVRIKTNRFGTYDVMRGEETQIFGYVGHYIQTQNAAPSGWLCLPGTHTKWARLEQGQLVEFTTSMTGEMFQTLSTHTILLPRAPEHPPEMDQAFIDGVKLGARQPALSALLFSVRAQTLAGVIKPDQAQNYLLGLLIGHDISTYMLDKHTSEPIKASPQFLAIIGGEGPAQFYAKGFEILGQNAEIYDGQTASLDGLKFLCF